MARVLRVPHPKVSSGFHNAHPAVLGAGYDPLGPPSVKRLK
jgi:hypothetical protein